MSKTTQKPDSEDALEQATRALFGELGYAAANLYHEVFRPAGASPASGEGGYWGRETTGEVVLTSRLQASLVKLNADLPVEPIRLAVEELTRDRSALNPVVANREVHDLIKGGVKVTFRNDDGATVPLYYENRIPELQLTNENLNHDMEALLDAAELDEDQERKLEREFSREYHLITRNDRLEVIAKDVVEHFVSRGHLGKGMVVCIDRFTAVRMYDKVQKHWQRRLKELRKEAEAPLRTDRDAIVASIAYMESTDMAVVVSGSQNEADAFKAKGLDILPHRKRMVKEDLETKFKDAEDPFRLVFVCAMWMTGFDVPCCSTIYLDKPMRNHTLMQTGVAVGVCTPRWGEPLRPMPIAAVVRDAFTPRDDIQE